MDRGSVQVMYEFLSDEDIVRDVVPIDKCPLLRTNKLWEKQLHLGYYKLRANLVQGCTQADWSKVSSSEASYHFSIKVIKVHFQGSSIWPWTKKSCTATTISKWITGQYRLKKRGGKPYSPETLSSAKDQTTFRTSFIDIARIISSLKPCC